MLYWFGTAKAVGKDVSMRQYLRAFALLTAVFSLFVFPAAARAEETPEIFQPYATDSHPAYGVVYYVDGDAGVLKITGDIRDLALLDRMKDAPVTKILDGAFASQPGLFSVAMPSGIRSVGANAFSDSANLKTLIFPGDAPEFSPDAFAGAADGLTVYCAAGASGWDEVSFPGVTICPLSENTYFDRDGDGVFTAADLALLQRRMSGDDGNTETNLLWAIFRTDAETVLTNASARLAGNITALPRTETRFVPCDTLPFLTSDTVVPFREDFNLHGTVDADSPITSVSVTITQEGSTRGYYPYERTVTFDPAANRRTYALTSADTLEGKSLDTLVSMTQLSAGENLLTLSVTTEAQPEPVKLAEVPFTVEKMHRMPLTVNHFSDNYFRVCDFFQGETEKFLFAYIRRGSRSIGTNEEWRTENIVVSPLGRVNKAALPYFEKANAYLESTYVRVSGTRGDSGVLLLKDLIEHISGPYVPRFQSGGTYVSHHALGTAIDVNPYTYPNTNSQSNWARIDDEVKQNLVYNGIATAEDGRQYYDFTYSGAYKANIKKVPTPLVNYLLYELAFYRAGFNWGHYFEHTSDAMHFTLTESEYYIHSDPDRGLRKVFAYIDE